MISSQWNLFPESTDAKYSALMSVCYLLFSHSACSVPLLISSLGILLYLLKKNQSWKNPLVCLLWQADLAGQVNKSAKKSYTELCTKRMHACTHAHTQWQQIMSFCNKNHSMVTTGPPAIEMLTLISRKLLWNPDNSCKSAYCLYYMGYISYLFNPRFAKFLYYLLCKSNLIQFYVV